MYQSVAKTATSAFIAFVASTCCVLAGTAAFAGTGGVTPTPSPIPQTHVLTAQDETGLKTFTYTWAQMAPYVNFMTVATGINGAVQAAGMQTMLYTDPNRASAQDPEFPTEEGGFAHDCSGNRITIVQRVKQTTYLLNVFDPNQEVLWQEHVANYNQGGHATYNMIFDDTPVVTNVSAMPCTYQQPLWLDAQNSMNTRMNYAIVFNGLANIGPGQDQLSPAMALLSTSVGGMMEGCYDSEDPSKPNPDLTVWHAYETTEIQVLADPGKQFWCRGLDVASDTVSQNARIYMLASFLLTYDPARSVFSPKWTPANSGFWIEPEEQLVALNPIMVQPTNIDQLSVDANTFGRQYANCYYAGQWVGPCASVVNDDSAGHSHTVPWTNLYHHTLVLTGGDILDGGTASMKGPPPPATIPGRTAIIEFQ